MINYFIDPNSTLKVSDCFDSLTDDCSNIYPVDCQDR